jgi:hypothetical protein
MKRRQLLGATAVLAAAPFAAAAALRDDATYLQGLIDAGKPIVGGSYRLSRPLNVRKQSWAMRGVSLAGDFPGPLVSLWNGSLEAVNCSLCNQHTGGLAIKAVKGSTLAMSGIKLV